MGGIAITRPRPFWDGYPIPTGTYSLAYDNLGRLTGSTTDYSFLARTLTNSYTYDAASNRATMTDPESEVTTYTYDTLDRLTNLTDFNNASFDFGYDALGRRTSLARPNGVSTSYSFDALSNLLSVLHQKGGTDVDGATYSYDAVGNRTGKTAFVQAKPNPVQESSSYAYDDVYRLTQTLLDGGLSETYTYDTVGNRTASLDSASNLYNESNQLTSTSTATYTYDNNGNTTSKTDSNGTTNYTWDFENWLIQIDLPGGEVVEFTYDPFGRRI